MTELVIAAYQLPGDDPLMDGQIVRCLQRDGSALWAVRVLGFCINRDGEKEHEPIPSSRNEAFLERCRFGTAEEAYAAWKRWRAREYPS